MDNNPQNERQEFRLQADIIRSDLTPEELEKAIRKAALNAPPVLMRTDHPDITDPSRKITHLFGLPGIEPIERTDEE